MDIGPITNKLIKSCSDEIKKPKTRRKILDNIVEPLMDDIKARYYYHFMFIITILLLIIILLIIIVTNILTSR